MTTLQKIEKLNEACNNSLSIVSRPDYWEIHSYGEDSPLEVDRHYPFIKAKTLAEVVDLAYEFVFGK